MMRFIRSSTLTLLAVAVVLGPAAVRVRATFNTAPNAPPAITFKQFNDAGFTPVNKGSFETFKMVGNLALSGKDVSQVFQDPKSKTYAYLYQVQIDNTPANAGNKAFGSFEITPWPDAFRNFTINKVQSQVFQITDLGQGVKGALPFVLPGGSVHYLTAKGVDNTSLEGNFTNNAGGSRLVRGTNSSLLVVFSLKPPQLVQIPIPNNPPPPKGEGLYVPTPVPEPSSLVMLALGGAGLTGLSWRRRGDRPRS